VSLSLLLSFTSTPTISNIRAKAQTAAHFHLHNVQVVTNRSDFEYQLTAPECSIICGTAIATLHMAVTGCKVAIASACCD